MRTVVVATSGQCPRSPIGRPPIDRPTISDANAVRPIVEARESRLAWAAGTLLPASRRRVVRAA